LKSWLTVLFKARKSLNVHVLCVQPSNQTLPSAIVGHNYIIIAQADTTLLPPAGATINDQARLL
jgi:hypothetical protein